MRISGRRVQALAFFSKLPRWFECEIGIKNHFLYPLPPFEFFFNNSKCYFKKNLTREPCVLWHRYLENTFLVDMLPYCAKNSLSERWHIKLVNLAKAKHLGFCKKFLIHKLQLTNYPRPNKIFEFFLFSYNNIKSFLAQHVLKKIKICNLCLLLKYWPTKLFECILFLCSWYLHSSFLHHLNSAWKQLCDFIV